MELLIVLKDWIYFIEGETAVLDMDIKTDFRPDFQTFFVNIRNRIEKWNNCSQIVHESGGLWCLQVLLSKLLYYSYMF